MNILLFEISQFSIAGRLLACITCQPFPDFFVILINQLAKELIFFIFKKLRQSFLSMTLLTGKPSVTLPMGFTTELQADAPWMFHFSEEY